MTNETVNFRQLQTPVALLAETKENGRASAHLRPKRGEDVAALLAELAQLNGTAVVCAPQPLPDANARALAFIDLSEINKVIEHSRPDQVISVESGMTVGHLDALLAKNDQWFPLACPAGRTIYDVITAGDGGFLEHGSGGPRNLVLGLQVALPNGSCIKTGGKVVKNVTGYDMTKLFVGSHGSLGVPVAAHLRLAARPQHAALIAIAAPEMVQLIDLARKVMASGLPLAGLELLHNELIGNPQCCSRRVAELCQELPGQAGMASPAHEATAATAVLSLFEHKRVIDEVVAALVQLVPSGLVHRSFDEQFSADPFRLYPEQCPRNFVELSCSLSQISALLAVVAQGKPPLPVQIRPGSGRLRIFCGGREAAQALIERLRQFCRARQLALTAAYINPPQSQLFVLPSADPCAADIKQSIKQRFDPDGCMNPYAQF